MTTLSSVYRARVFHDEGGGDGRRRHSRGAPRAREPTSTPEPDPGVGSRDRDAGGCAGHRGGGRGGVRPRARGRRACAGVGRRVVRNLRRDVDARGRGRGEAGVPREDPERAVATQPHVQRLRHAKAQPPGQDLAQDGRRAGWERRDDEASPSPSSVRDGGGQLPFRARRRRRARASRARPAARQVTPLPRVRGVRGRRHIHRGGRRLGGEAIGGARRVCDCGSRAPRRRVHARGRRAHRRDRRAAGRGDTREGGDAGRIDRRRRGEGRGRRKRRGR